MTSVRSKPPSKYTRRAAHASRAARARLARCARDKAREPDLSSYAPSTGSLENRRASSRIRSSTAMLLSTISGSYVGVALSSPI